MQRVNGDAMLGKKAKRTKEGRKGWTQIIILVFASALMLQVPREAFCD